MTDSLPTWLQHPIGFLEQRNRLLQMQEIVDHGVCLRGWLKPRAIGDEVTRGSLDILDAPAPVLFGAAAQ